jgi:hypothetical protein
MTLTSFLNLSGEQFECDNDKFYNLRTGRYVKSIPRDSDFTSSCDPNITGTGEMMLKFKKINGIFPLNSFKVKDRREMLIRTLIISVFETLNDDPTLIKPLENKDINIYTCVARFQDKEENTKLDHVCSGEVSENFAKDLSHFCSSKISEMTISYDVPGFKRESLINFIRIDKWLFYFEVGYVFKND